MDSLEKYFTKNEAEYLPECIIYKKINDYKKNNYNEYDDDDDEYNDEYDLSRKNLRIYDNYSEIYDPKEFFSNFVSLEKNDLTLPNLKQLEGTFILLEWKGDFLGNSAFDCSHISFMKVYKHPEGMNAGEGIHVCEARYKFLYNTPMMDHGKSNYMFEFLTPSKLTEIQRYYTDKVYWSYLWKIWIPSHCYKKLFSSIHYRMCLRRVFNIDIAYKISSFV